MARRKKGLDIHGWLLIDKPRGMTSNDVVGKTRRIFNANKNGHTGTLDPFATGLLPIAFGEATKLIPFVTDGMKEYEFVVQWGEETDTLDIEGKVIATSDIIPSKADILQIIPEFLGEIEQVPPQYSAIKIDGERAYDLARQGKEFEVPSRIITIYELELLEELPDNQAKFRVKCSKGTYVRTLGKDIALRLGTRGYLKELRRTKSYPFQLDGGIKLENLEKMVYEKTPERVLLPVQTCLRDIAVIALSEEDAAKLRLGQGLSPKAYDAKLGEAVAQLDGELVAIVDVSERKISPVRVFNFNK